MEQWIKDAVSGGAVLHTGGDRRGAMVSPAILGKVSPTLKISCNELFGPAVGLTPG